MLVCRGIRNQGSGKHGLSVDVSVASVGIGKRGKPAVHPIAHTTALSPPADAMPGYVPARPALGLKPTAASSRVAPFV